MAYRELTTPILIKAQHLVIETPIMGNPAPPHGQPSPVSQRILLAVFLITTFLPILSVEFPPLVDLPAHTMRFYIAYFAPPDARVHEFYDFDPILVPNLGFDLLMWGLSYIMGFDAALRCAHLIVSGLIAGGIYSVSQAIHGRLTLGAIFAVPFLMSWSYQIGFLNYVISVCVALIAIQTYLRLRDRVLLRRALVLVPLSFVTWVSHVVGWGVLMLLVCGVELIRLTSSKDLSIRQLGQSAISVLICAGPAVATFFWLISFTEVTGGNLNFQLDQKIKGILGLFKIYWMTVDLGFYCMTLIAAGWFWRRFGIVAELGAGAGLLLVAFLALPTAMGTTFFLDRRLMMPLGAVFFLALRPGGTPAWATIPLAYSIAMAVAWNLISAQQTDEARSLDMIAPGERVLSVTLDHCLPPSQRWELPKHSASARDVVIKKDGFSNATFNLPDSNGLSFRHGRPFDAVYHVVGHVYLSQDCPNAFFHYPTITTLDRIIAELEHSVYDWLWLANTKGVIHDLGPNYKLMHATDQTAIYRIHP